MWYRRCVCLHWKLFKSVLQWSLVFNLHSKDIYETVRFLEDGHFLEGTLLCDLKGLECVWQLLLLFCFILFYFVLFCLFVCFKMELICIPVLDIFSRRAHPCSLSRSSLYWCEPFDKKGLGCHIWEKPKVRRLWNKVVEVESRSNACGKFLQDKYLLTSPILNI